MQLGVIRAMKEVPKDKMKPERREPSILPREHGSPHKYFHAVKDVQVLTEHTRWKKGSSLS